MSLVLLIFCARPWGTSRKLLSPEKFLQCVALCFRCQLSSNWCLCHFGPKARCWPPVLLSGPSAGFSKHPSLLEGVCQRFAQTFHQLLYPLTQYLVQSCRMLATGPHYHLNSLCLKGIQPLPDTTHIPISSHPPQPFQKLLNSLATLNNLAQSYTFSKCLMPFHSSPCLLYHSRSRSLFHAIRDAS